MLFKKIPRSILCTTTSEVKRHHRVRLTLAPKSIHSLNERCYLRNAVSSFLLGRTSDTVGGHVNSTRVSAVRRDAQTAAKRLGVHAVRRDTRALELRDVGRGSHCHRRQSGTSDPSGASTHGCFLRSIFRSSSLLVLRSSLLRSPSFYHIQMQPFRMVIPTLRSESEVLPPQHFIIRPLDTRPITVVTKNLQQEDSVRDSQMFSQCKPEGHTLRQFLQQLPRFFRRWLRPRQTVFRRSSAP